MIRSILLLRAAPWLLLAGFYLGSFTSALPLIAPDYSRASFPWNQNYRHSLDNSLIARVPQILTASDLGKRDSMLSHELYEDAYRKTTNCFQDLLSSSLDLSRLSEDVTGFEALLVNSLRLYHNNLLCIRTSLDYLGNDRGLQNYDRSSELETLLKKVVNVHKDTLSYLDSLVYRIPGVGPVVGPIMYDIKCILDKLLDSVENISDALINKLRPLLAACSLDTLGVACKSGLSLLGVCL